VVVGSISVLGQFIWALVYHLTCRAFWPQITSALRQKTGHSKFIVFYIFFTQIAFRVVTVGGFMDFVFAGLIGIGIVVYLMYALLYPEKF
jgi:K+-transporting ATPase KdpF subunit